MPALLSEEEIDEMDYDDESDHVLISTEMLKEIHDRSQSHQNVDKIESCYKISGRIKQRQPEWKVVSKVTQNMGKVLHKVFKTVVKDISQDFPPLGESSSEVSDFIPEPGNFLK